MTLSSCKNSCSAQTICQLAEQCERPTGSRPFTVLEYLSPASCGGFLCLGPAPTDLLRVQRITKVLSAVPKILGGKLHTAHFLHYHADLTCASGTWRQNCTRCTLKMWFPPGRSRPAFFAGGQNYLCLSVPCIYNMLNKILKRRFFTRIFSNISFAFTGIFVRKKRRPYGLLLNNLARFCHADAGRSDLVIRIDVSAAI